MRDELVAKLSEYFKEKGFSKAVVGLSGGLDSSVTCFLLSEALGGENVLAFSLPYFQEDPDVDLVANRTGIKLTRLNITKPVDALCDLIKAEDKVSKGNIMARVRMAVLYHFARENDALVVGTGNRTEWMMGYFTKHGDIACDVLPLAKLYKSEVRGLARELGMPGKIIEKEPTAGLWPGQTDEGELGMSYEKLDSSLMGGGSELHGRILQTEHKRKGPDVL